MKFRHPRRSRRNDQHSPCSSSTGALGRFYRRIYLRGPLRVTPNDVDQIKFRNYDEIFDEVDQLQYSWCVFHLVLCGAALFVMLTLTNLYYPKRSTKASYHFEQGLSDGISPANVSLSDREARHFPIFRSVSKLLISECDLKTPTTISPLTKEF